MPTSSSTATSLARAPWFKYGMLGFILLLALFNIAVYLQSAATRSSVSVMNLLTTSLLLVNHLCISFLSERWQRRVMVPQFLFIGLVLVYIVLQISR